MVNNKFIHCRKCDAVHHVTAFDKAPIYILSARGPSETAANDWNDFMGRHAGHRLDSLEATGQVFFPGGVSGDPMAIGYIEATDGKATVLLRRVRASIHEPMRYEIVPGRLVHRASSLDIQENSLRKEMKLHFPWAPAQPLSDEKIDLFGSCTARSSAPSTPLRFAVTSSPLPMTRSPTDRWTGRRGWPS